MAFTFANQAAVGHEPKEATVVLDRQVVGIVVSGDQRGRTLGFPTANIVLPNVGRQLDDGVYAAFIQSDSLPRAAAAVSVGRRPTFYAEGERLMEVFVLDYAGDLYGKRVTVNLAHFLRPQKRFESIDALRQQLNDDVAAVRAALAARH